MFISGQALGLIVYIRNLVLIFRARREEAVAEAQDDAVADAPFK